MKRLIYGVAGIVILGGCVQNHYKISTAYSNPQDSVAITTEVEGKATIGKVAYIYKQGLEFCNKQYIKGK